MKNIYISNGSGWNNYAGLKNLSMPREVAGLLKSNNIHSLHIRPYSPDKPLGIGAFFCRETDDGESTVYTVIFDGNTSRDDIREGVLQRLNEGIQNCLARRAREVEARVQTEKARLDAIAQAKGFSDHKTYQAHENQLRWEAAAKVEKYLNHPETAKTAVKVMLEALETSPNAVRLTRAGQLFDANEHPTGVFVGITEVRAWLIQNGFRNSLDDRHHFFTFVRNLTNHEKLQYL